ncbi:hypothetical protein DAPPUDRAFT_333347 [Daphnia pulex]|uniref:Peptidase M13 N-terminal domain-containing protein n=1 Tax=Daphnia pulex TaxID=6669 RepID=E9HSL0_DAPPU|nr:hypothetical protein DAPPUDRAFT_333347 [Daphnia pulex]|eukprot:EFX65281.1 hypothetical protein DAPPUDRAFT_333347 [Daphnia pulex]
MAALIYRDQQNNPSKVFDSETLAMVSPSAAAFTDSSHEVLDLDKATKSDADPSAKSANGNVCNTSGCVMAAAEILKNINKTVNPCEDFYSFACGGFETRNVIPDDQSSVTTFSLISDEVTEQLRSLIERPIKKTDAEPFKLVKKLFQSCLNKTRAEERVGLAPLKEVLDQFGGWPVVVGDSWDDSTFVWTDMIYKFRLAGYSIDYFVDFSVTTDLKNSTSRIIDLDQATLGLSREYLIKGLGDKDVKAYLDYQDKDSATKQRTEALEFEIKHANINLPRVERRDANKLYNPMTIKELSLKLPEIPCERVVVDVPDYFPKLVDLLAKTPKRDFEYLQKVESSNLKDFNLARAGQAIKRQQSFAQKTKDRRILQYADALRAGELTVYHFLEVCAQFFEPAVLPIVPAEEPPHADHSDDDEIDPPVRGRGGRARRLRVRRNGNGRAARQAPIVPGQRMPRNRRAGRGGGAVGGGPGRERDVVNPNHAALDPELILQQAMVEVGLPIDVANNQPLIEEAPLLDMDCEICMTKLKSGQELKIRALWKDAVMCAAHLLQ